MTNPILNGPQAPENNPAIEPQWFQPSVFPITGITLGANTIVTTGSSFGITQNYVIGQLVRFTIPFFYGTRQLDQQTGYVIQINGTNQFTVQINSTGYDNFIPSPTYGPTPPQIAAVGDVNTGIISSTGQNIPTTTIPGAFINISPAAGG